MFEAEKSGAPTSRDTSSASAASPSAWAASMSSRVRVFLPLPLPPPTCRSDLLPPAAAGGASPPAAGPSRAVVLPVASPPAAGPCGPSLRSCLADSRASSATASVASLMSSARIRLSLPQGSCSHGNGRAVGGAGKHGRESGSRLACCFLMSAFAFLTCRGSHTKTCLLSSSCFETAHGDTCMSINLRVERARGRSNALAPVPSRRLLPGEHR